MLCGKCHSEYLNPPTNLGQFFGTVETRCQVCQTSYRFSDRLKIAIPLITLAAELIGLHVTQLAAILGTPLTLISFAATVAALVYLTAVAIQRPLVPSDDLKHPAFANTLAVATIIACFAYLVI